jgi:single-stranded DNA-binding protein
MQKASRIAPRSARPARKGSRIAVSGRLRSRFYDPNGKERGGSLRPTVIADGIDYLTPPRAEAHAPAPAAKGAK